MYSEKSLRNTFTSSTRHLQRDSSERVSTASPLAPSDHPIMLKMDSPGNEKYIILNKTEEIKENQRMSTMSTNSTKSTKSTMSTTLKTSMFSQRVFFKRTKNEKKTKMDKKLRTRLHFKNH